MIRVLACLAVCAVLGAWLVGSRIVQDRWRLTAIVLLVPALLVTGNEFRWYRFESAMARAVVPVVGQRKVSLVCERVGRNFFASQGRPGHVWFDAEGKPSDEAFLSMETCAKVRRFRGDPGRAALLDVHGVLVMTHEAGHLSGERDESATECLAQANAVTVMMRLGAGQEDAERHLESYRREIVPRMPSEYRGECR